MRRGEREASTRDGMTSPARSMSSSAWAVNIPEWCDRGTSSSVESHTTSRWLLEVYLRLQGRIGPRDGAITCPSDEWRLFVAPNKAVAKATSSACRLGVGLSGAPVWRSVMASLSRADDGGGGAMVGGYRVIFEARGASKNKRFLVWTVSR
jgi:hypothetical protein